MYFRKLSAPRLQRVTVSAFPGLDRREGAAAGSFSHMENLCPQGYPAMKVRRRRGRVAVLDAPGGLTAKETLVWVDGHTLYVGGHATGLVLQEGEKQFVSMGAYLVIWPDKAWINLRDLSSFGRLEHAVTTAGEVSFSLCRRGDGAWTEVADVCVRIQCGGIGAGFQAGDGVEISGCGVAALNGNHVLRWVDEDTLVVGGTVPGDRVQAEAVTVRRAVPEMDFVTECGNRLWGCKYGVVNGRAVNEVYASKLGDFRNWNCWEGLSTDSYAASRGSDGPFTAAAAYLGSVLFFKENCIERLYPSASGAHQMVTLECPGVGRGSSRSLQTVEGVLYYLGRGGVYAFDGSLPVKVSAALGSAELCNGCAGALEGRYYLSAAEGEKRHLLTYDVQRGAWHRQDGLAVRDFARHDGELFALTAAGELLALEGGSGEQEGPVSWQAVTPPLGLQGAEHKYPLRLSLQLRLARGSTVRAAVSYDDGGTWHEQGGLTGRGGTGAVTLHLRPRRCAQLRLRLEGTGDCTLYAASAVYEKGSDET